MADAALEPAVIILRRRPRRSGAAPPGARPEGRLLDDAARAGRGPRALPWSAIFDMELQRSLMAACEAKLPRDIT